MATLIMGFSKARRQKAPALPPRSDSESEDEECQPEVKPNSMSIDTDAIIREANAHMEESHASMTSLGDNRIPLPKAIDRSIQLN
jgi:hypothetical protein